MIVDRKRDWGRWGVRYSLCASEGLQTVSSRESHTSQGKSMSMNLLTDILAGLVHFVGWLV
ncbi:hypothetical protein [Streptomyces phaeoluteigriseus]